jgi:hypothetical protein
MLAQNLPAARSTPRLPLQVLTNKRIKHELTPAKLLTPSELRTASLNDLTASPSISICEDCEAEKERALTLESALLNVNSENTILERELSGLELYLADLLAGLKDKKRRIGELKGVLRSL